MNALVIECEEFAYVSGSSGEEDEAHARDLLGSNCTIEIRRLRNGVIAWRGRHETTHLQYSQNISVDVQSLVIYCGVFCGEKADSISNLVGCLGEQGSASDQLMLPEGEYAAIYVDISESIIRCVRDKFGVVPLYALRNEHYTIVSQSWINAKRFSKRVPNLRHMIDAIVEDFSSLMSIYDDIAVINPGRCIELRKDQSSFIDAECNDHDKLNYDISKNSEFGLDAVLDEIYNSLVSAIDTIVGESKEFHLLLSGGLDSTLIASIGHKVLGKRIIAHTFRPQGPNVVGEQGIEQCISSVNLASHHWVDIADADLFSLTAEACRSTGAIVPFLHGGARLRLARSIGIDSELVLGGEGSDEYFFGYPYMYPSVTTATVEGVATMGWAPKAGSAHPNPRHGFVEQMRSRVSRIGLFVNHEAVANHNLQPGYSRDKEVMLAHQLQWDQKRILGNYSLRYLGREIDQIGKTATRLPFLDPKVTSIAAKISPYVHLYDGRGKYVLREMAKKYQLLCADCLNRTKQGFIAAPSGSAWLGFDAVSAFITEDEINRQGVFSVLAVEKLKKSVRENSADLADRMLLCSVWSAQVAMR